MRVSVSQATRTTSHACANRREHNNYQHTPTRTLSLTREADVSLVGALSQNCTLVFKFVQNRSVVQLHLSSLNGNKQRCSVKMDTRLEYIFLTMVLMTGGSQIATVTVSAVPLAQETPKCDLFLYYDHGTGTCEPCRGLCYAAAVQRTEDQCQALCSDYLMSLNCTDDQYYDDVVRECSPCSELCKDRSITGTAEQCTNKCRAYLDKLEKEREPPKIQSHDLQQVNMDKPADVDQPLEEEEEPQSGPLTPAGIAGVVVAGVVLLVIVVVVIVIMAKKRRQNRYMLTPQSDTGTKPVQATSPGPIPETDPQATGSPAYNPT